MIRKSTFALDQQSFYMWDTYPEEYIWLSEYSLGILYLISGGICFHNIAMLGYRNSPPEQAEEKCFAQGHDDDRYEGIDLAGSTL